MSSSKKIDMKNGLCGRCLSEYSQSYWYFRPSFVNCCHSNLLSVQSPSLLPPPFLVWISILYTVCLCVGGGYVFLGLRQINTCRKVPLQVNFLRWRHFALPSMSLIFLRRVFSAKGGVLDEHDSAKPAQRSSYNGPPGCIGWTQFKPM